jgi:hypothetical protein
VLSPKHDIRGLQIAVHQSLLRNMRDSGDQQLAQCERHFSVGMVAMVRSANDSLLRGMASRAQQVDDVLVRLEKQV